MLVRISGGMARFGLPGVILGVAISWMAGARGPLAEAQTRAGERAVHRWVCRFVGPTQIGLSRDRAGCSRVARRMERWRWSRRLLVRPSGCT